MPGFASICAQTRRLEPLAGVPRCRKPGRRDLPHPAPVPAGSTRQAITGPSDDAIRATRDDPDGSDTPPLPRHHGCVPRQSRTGQLTTHEDERRRDRRRLGRHRSTVFRELRRNRHHDAEIPELRGYWGVLAQKLALGRRFRHRKLVRHPDLRRMVISCLWAGWSPEQISGRMRVEQAPLRVSQEAIYPFVYSEEGRAAELWRHLASGRQPPNRRRPRSGRSDAAGLPALCGRW